MTCYYCEFQFCWICGETYTSDHFTALNPFGCGGMQFGSNRPSIGIGSMSLLYLKRFLIIVAGLILVPLALVLGPPFLCLLGAYELI
ncbi:MAG: hypothetical protein ACK56F_17115, partial [bacterium]